jgi:hypothetical protein
VTWLGLAAVFAMLLFYAYKSQSHWYVLAFAGACALVSIYGFVQREWSFGTIEAIWATVAVQRWRRRRN